MSIRNRKQLYRNWQQMLVIIAIGSVATAVQGQVLLEVNLSVTDQVTITATGEASIATISGSDTIGVYLEDFFTADGTSLLETLISGDLTSAENSPDFSPNLFRGGTTDPGLNIWSWTNDPDAIFISGNPAFSGSGTWGLNPDNYAEFLAANTSGNLYFPADTADDVASATLIGTYIVLTKAGCDFELGDVNMDGNVNLLDVAPFVAILTDGSYQCEADADQNGMVNLLDVTPFVDLITGG